MKRAAEKQLNKNDADQDVDMEGGGASDGFMKADDSALAARPYVFIHVLPPSLNLNGDQDARATTASQNE